MKTDKKKPVGERSLPALLFFSCVGIKVATLRYTFLHRPAVPTGGGDICSKPMCKYNMNLESDESVDRVSDSSCNETDNECSNHVESSL